MADTRWLERRYQGWYVVKDVPRPLRSVVGRKRFIKSLGTRDLHVAVARRHAALAEFGRIIAAAQSRSTVDPIVEAGIAWRDTFASIDRGDPAVVDHLGRDLDEAYETASLVFSDEIDRILDEKGDAAAKAFHDLARGLATPLLHYVDPWQAEGGTKGPLQERTKRQYRADLAELAAWATGAGIPPTIEAITKQVASRYVTEAMLGSGVERNTVNRKISAASAYWRWLLKRTSFEQDHDFRWASDRGS